MLASGELLRGGLPGADADPVALWVGQDRERRGLRVAHQDAARGQRRVDALVGDRRVDVDVEVPALAGLVMSVALLEPGRGHPTVGVDDLEVLLVPVVAE